MTAFANSSGGPIPAFPPGPGAGGVPENLLNQGGPSLPTAPVLPPAAPGVPPPPANTGVPPSICNNATAELQALIKSPVENARGRLLGRWNYFNPSRDKSLIDEARDRVRYWLEVRHEHIYPTTILNGDEETPVTAFAYAKNALGDLPDKQAQLLNFTTIEQTLQKNLSDARGFQRLRSNDLDTISSLVAERQWITNALKDPSLHYDIPKEDPSIATVLPTEPVKPDQITPTIPLTKNNYGAKSSPDLAGSRAELEIRKRELTKDINYRLNKVFIPAEDPNLQQVYRLKTLEVYYLEMKKQLTRRGLDKFPSIEVNGVATDSNAQKIYEGISDLYEKDPKTGGNLNFKAAVKPPDWAWNRMHWAWFWGETKSVLAKDFPAFKKKVEDNSFVKFWDSLSDADKKLILGKNITDEQAIWKRTKPAGLLLAVTSGASATGGASYWLKVGYNYFIYDKKARNDIVTTQDPKQAAEKTRLYLQETHFMRGLLGKLGVRKDIWDDHGKLVDKDAIKELKEINQSRIKQLKEDDPKLFNAEDQDILTYFKNWSPVDDLNKTAPTTPKTPITSIPAGPTTPSTNPGSTTPNTTQPAKPPAQQTGPGPQIPLQPGGNNPPGKPAPGPQIPPGAQPVIPGLLPR